MSDLWYSDDDQGEYHYEQEGIHRGGNCYPEGEPYAETIQDMQHRIDYLEQEVDFLKNFICRNFKEIEGLLMDEFSCIYEVIQSAVINNENHLSVAYMCEIAGVSRSGCYAWLKAAPARAEREEQDRKDFDLILQVCKQGGYSKGAKSIYMCLIHMDPLLS